jgi:hypothetical protein
VTAALLRMPPHPSCAHGCSPPGKVCSAAPAFLVGGAGCLAASWGGIYYCFEDDAVTGVRIPARWAAGSARLGYSPGLGVRACCGWSGRDAASAPRVQGPRVSECWQTAVTADGAGLSARLAGDVIHVFTCGGRRRTGHSPRPLSPAPALPARTACSAEHWSSSCVVVLDQPYVGARGSARPDVHPAGCRQNRPRGWAVSGGPDCVHSFSCIRHSPMIQRSGQSLSRHREDGPAVNACSCRRRRAVRYFVPGSTARRFLVGDASCSKTSPRICSTAPRC